MIVLLLASVLAGLVLSAPIGVTGALIADAALIRDRRQLRLNIAGATFADLVLAALVALFAAPLAEVLDRHRQHAMLVAGAAFVLCGLGMAAAAWRQQRRAARPDAAPPAGPGWLPHLASSGTAFLGTVLHPGSVAAFLVTGALFALKLPEFSRAPFLFVFGIGLGALAMYAAVAAVFWKFSRHAARFLLELRYGTAILVLVVGGYLLVRVWS